MKLVLENSPAVLQMLDEDKREATTKATEAIWQLFVYELSQKLEHMYTHVQQIIAGKKTKCLSTHPLQREVFLHVLFPPFYDILYILLRYSPLRSETVSPSAADFYILHNRSTSLSVTRYGGKCICGSYFVISKLDVEDIKTTLLWNKKPFFKVRIIWNF